MVLFRTESWVLFKEYGEGCRRGYYSFHDKLDGVELRIHCGKLCFSRLFDPEAERGEEQQKILKEMEKFCEIQGFIKIEETTTEEYFHV
jgi:hypothetical protein